MDRALALGILCVHITLGFREQRDHCSSPGGATSSWVRIEIGVRMRMRVRVSVRFKGERERKRKRKREREREASPASVRVRHEAAASIAQE